MSGIVNWFSEASHRDLFGSWTYGTGGAFFLWIAYLMFFRYPLFFYLDAVKLGPGARLDE